MCPAPRFNRREVTIDRWQLSLGRGLVGGQGIGGGGVRHRITLPAVPYHDALPSVVRSRYSFSTWVKARMFPGKGCPELLWLTIVGPAGTCVSAGCSGTALDREV